MTNGNFQYAPPPPPNSRGQNPPPAQQQAAPPQTDAATQFCRDCGQPVQPGSAVCLNCNYILDPEAFRRAQQLVGKRNRQKMQPRAAVRPQQPFPQQPRQPGTRMGQPMYGGSVPRRSQRSETAEAIGDAVVSILRRYDILPPPPAERQYPNTPPVQPQPTYQTQQQQQSGVPDMPSLILPGEKKSEPAPQPVQQQSAPKVPDATDPEAVKAALPKNAETAARPRYHFNTSGDVFCPKCGTEVDMGACQCIHCGYVIDEKQYALAMQQMNDRNAELDHKDLVKSYLVPGYGKKMYEQNHLRRPQIAEPCLKAAKVNKFLTTLLIILILLLLLFI